GAHHRVRVSEVDRGAAVHHRGRAPGHRAERATAAGWRVPRGSRLRAPLAPAAGPARLHLRWNDGRALAAAAPGCGNPRSDQPRLGRGVLSAGDGPAPRAGDGRSTIATAVRMSGTATRSACGGASP